MYRIDVLLKANQQLFHTRDLALLWGITNNNTLYTTIKRYVNKKILIPIHKGFYSTKPLDSIDPYRLGASYLHFFSYVSCETVLFQKGIIFQKPESINFLSNKAQKFKILSNQYYSRKLPDKYLFNPKGLELQNNVLFASCERATADMLYFNLHYHFDNRMGINWKKVKEIQKEVYDI
jgi:hypothetical protein